MSAIKLSYFSNNITMC